MSNRALNFVYLRQTNMIPNMKAPDNHNRNQINTVLSAGGLVFEKTKLSFDFTKSVQLLTDVESRLEFSLLAPNKYDSKYVNTRKQHPKSNQPSKISTTIN